MQVRNIAPGISVGGQGSCQGLDRKSQKYGGIIHACKDPCHVTAVGSRKLDKDHKEYLYALRGGTYHLVLNMIDPELPLFKPEMFAQAMYFIAGHKPVLIHCNQGLSRAPSIALLWLAKAGIICDRDFESARKEYLALDPDYAPGKGLVTFLTENWRAL